MQEILCSLPAGARVLDLGCQYGSFPAQSTQATVIRLDRDAPASPPGALYVQADAARLPFATHSFDAVIANHSLEHFDQLNDVLRDLGRILRPTGALFVAVPDANTLTDKLYRWMGKGGGHVNPFTDPAELAQAIERLTGLPAVSQRTLYSGLSFLNRRRAPRPLPRRLWLFGGGSELSLFLYVFLSRKIDRYFHTRTAVYGWAFTFGSAPPPADRAPWPNVCIRCGSGAAARELSPRSLLTFTVYTCPHCGATNPFCQDEPFMPD